MYNVEIVETKTNKVVSVIGRNMTKESAEKRELTGISRIDIGDYFVRTVKSKGKRK